MSTPRRSRFRPGGWDALEERIVLSPAAFRLPIERPALAGRLGAAARPLPAPAARPTPRAHPTPSVVIDRHYEAFRADVLEAFNRALASLQVPLSQTVRLTLSEPYEPGKGLFFVDQNELPVATPQAPLQVAARPIGAAPRLYQVTGTAAGLLSNVQVYNPTTGGFGAERNPQTGAVVGLPPDDGPLPAGTTLEIAIPTASPDAGGVANQYLNAVAQRTQRLSSDLVTYFNRLPIRLPRLPGPYHSPRPQTAIQFYLTGQIAGRDPQILLQQLLAQPLPPAPSIDVYIDSISTIIETSRQQVGEGVRLLFAGRSIADIQPVIPAQP